MTTTHENDPLTMLIDALDMDEPDDSTMMIGGITTALDAGVSAEKVSVIAGMTVRRVLDIAGR